MVEMRGGDSFKSTNILISLAISLWKPFISATPTASAHKTTKTLHHEETNEILQFSDRSVTKRKVQRRREHIPETKRSRNRKGSWDEEVQNGDQTSE
jgi:hypothetical protein